MSRTVSLLAVLLVAVAVAAATETRGAEGRPKWRGSDDCGAQYHDGCRRPMHTPHRAVIRRPAPDFDATAVIGGEIQNIRLSDYAGKYVVLLFYPMDFTFVCPTEVIAFNDRVAEFRAINTEVIALSVDSKYVHLAWVNTPREQGGLGPTDIPLVADITRSISRDYGVLLEEEGHTLRGLFIIDGKGILRQVTMNDLPVGRSVDETLRLVQAFQFTDQHDEVCPAGWRPGANTIRPHPLGKLDYFGSVGH